MTTFHAQPYDMNANGFYFEDMDEYTEKAQANRNEFGEPVEEYELQFIDGSDLEAELFKDANHYHEIKERLEWLADVVPSDRAIAAAIYLTKQYGFGKVKDYIEDDLEGIIIDEHDGWQSEEQSDEHMGYYYAEALDIPDQIQNYFDYEAYGRDHRLNGCFDVELIGGTTYYFNTDY